MTRPAPVNPTPSPAPHLALVTEPSQLLDPHALAEAQDALRAALGFSDGSFAHDAEDLARLGFTDPFVARQALTLLVVARHHDADDVPNINIAEHYRLALGGMVLRMLHPVTDATGPTAAL